MSLFYKVFKNESPRCLFNTIPNNNEQRQTRHSDNIPTFFARDDYFKNSFFPSAITEWNKLDCFVKNEDSFHVFKKHILNFIRPLPNSIFNIHNPLGIKYLTRLRIGFIHLKEHKFRHNFQDSVCAAAAVVLKQQNIFFSIAQTSIFKDKPSSTKQLL